MSFYSTQDVRKFITDIRLLLTEPEVEVSDTQALDIIEDYVLSIDCSDGYSYMERTKLVYRLFVSLRCEMDILQPLINDSSVSEIMVNGKDKIFV